MGRFSIVKREKIERALKGKNSIDILSDYIVFDIETTGLDSSYDEVIEIGAIKVKDIEIISENVFYNIIDDYVEI